MNKYFRTGLALAALACSSSSPSFAASFPVIRESVIVCDPNAPHNCIIPAADGSIAVTGGGGGGGGGAVTAVSGAYASGSIVDIGTGTSPAANTVNARLAAILAAVGTPFQAGASIGNTSFGISGTLPAFAATPTFNLGTLNGAATASNQTGGGQKTQIVDGSGNIIASTSNNLNVQCANCSGSGASAVDEASFTAGTSVMAPVGVFFQTTATSNPLTNGQQGMIQGTAQRAAFMNLRDSSGTEIGVSTAPVEVSIANTGANATAVKVDGSAVTQPVSGTVAATQSGTWIVQPGNTANTTAWKVDGSAVTQPISGTVSAAQSGTWNVTNVSGTVSLPTGAATSAKQPALGTAGAASADVLTVQGVASMTALKVDGSAVTQPISAASLPLPTGAMGSSGGTVGLVAGSAVIGHVIADTGSTTAVTSLPATPAGTNVIGKVSIDQTTPGTTNLVAVSNTSFASTQSGTWTVQPGNTANTTAWKVDGSAVTQPVSIATAPVLVAGSAIIGKVGIDQTTPGTTNLVALAANQSVNIAQMNGVTTTMGNGASGTGVQRVTIASDSTGQVVLAAGSALAGKVGIDQTTPGTTNGVQDAATGSTGSAVPAKASYVGAVSSGNLTGLIQADASVAINVSTATTTQLVALSSGKKIYVTALDVIAGGTGNITFEYGTGSTCGTGTTVLTGAYNLTAQTGIAKGSGLAPVLIVPASNALCVVTSAAVQMSGSVAYTQF